MSSWKRISMWALTFLAVGLVLAGAAGAQAGSGVLQGGRISDVEIAVWRTGDKAELARLSLGDTLVLDAGEEVLLRAYAPRGDGPGNQRWYLPVTFYVASVGNQVRLSDVNSDKGSCTLRATGQGGGRATEIRYQLAKRIQVSRPQLAHGTFFFKVERATSTTRPPSGGRPGSSGGGRQTAERDMVDRLFQGILLREPGNAGDDYERKLRREGYEGLVDMAYDVAESRESQRLMHSRGNTSTERLEAIYKHLLDLKPSEIDRYQWRDHMEMMNQGDVTGVVMDIVRSPEFRRVHGYQAYGRHDR